MIPIARTVFEVERFALLNGDEVEVRPLPIKYMREIQKQWSSLIKKMIEADSDDLDAMEVMDEEYYQAIISIAARCLSLVNKKAFTSEEIEEECDDETIAYVIRKCAKIDVSPKDEGENLATVPTNPQQ